jgi:hypothetical protein
MPVLVSMAVGKTDVAVYAVLLRSGYVHTSLGLI